MTPYHIPLLLALPAAAWALDYDAMAARIVSSLKLEPGERVLLHPDPEIFRELLPPLRKRLQAAGAREVTALDAATDVYLWLPLHPSRRQLPEAEAQALVRWLDQGGSHRQIHFHWADGSRGVDGLAGQHTPALDDLYQKALEADYAALSRAQQSAIARLRSGVVRVRAPGGTDLTFRVGQRPFNKQDGDASRERMKSARVRVDREVELPAGVLRVAPLEETVNGRMLAFEFRGGAAPGGERFREFALGFHPGLAVAPGSPTVPYYGYGAGVVRLSVGDNQELGGAVKGGAVRWYFFTDATVEVDGRTLVRGGRLLP